MNCILHKLQSLSKNHFMITLILCAFCYCCCCCLVSYLHYVQYLSIHFSLVLLFRRCSFFYFSLRRSAQHTSYRPIQYIEVCVPKCFLKERIKGKKIKFYLLMISLFQFWNYCVQMVIIWDRTEFSNGKYSFSIVLKEKKKKKKILFSRDLDFFVVVDCCSKIRLCNTFCFALRL